MDKAEIDKIRSEIVMAALPHIAFDGWSQAILEQGAMDAGYDKTLVRAVFISPVKDALDHFAVLADREMLRRLEQMDSSNLRIRDKIAAAVMARFEFLNEHKEAFRRSVQYWMIPLRKPRAAKIVWRSADEIWIWAGDDSTDYNRYTKRALLSGILASTSLVFLSDEDGHLHNTKSFLDRRIENVMQFNKIIGKYKKAS